MPDGDKFERGLDKQWRKPYRLACGNTQSSILVDAFIESTANDLRSNLPCPSIDEITDAISEAISAQSQFQFGFASTNPVDPHYLLCCRLEEIQTKDIQSPVTRLAVQAAQSVYAKLEADDGKITLRTIQDSFSEEFVTQVIDHRCLSSIRDVLMKKSGRNLSDQAEWEASLIEQVKPQARKLLRSAFRDKGSNIIRAPKRLSQRTNWTIERLNQPLSSVEKK
jgi:hypothetical protein